MCTDPDGNSLNYIKKAEVQFLKKKLPMYSHA